MAEVRNRKEGALRWVYASGSGNTWATASGATTGLIGYVTNYQVTSGRTVATISDRGTPTHHKHQSDEAIQVSFDVQYGVTAQWPSLSDTGQAGHTMPGLLLLELRMSAIEIGATSAIYEQLHGVALNQRNFSEADDANTLSWQGMALAAVGPTGSGYLA